jgi:hypothetical protein
MLPLFLNLAWALLLNGLTLGVYNAIGTAYSLIVTAPPYNLADTGASYVNCVRIVVALITCPSSRLGLVDRVQKYAAIMPCTSLKVRLLPLIIPIIIGVFNIILYEQGAAHPERYRWFKYIWGLAAYNSYFVGANISAIKYLNPGSEGQI